MLQSPSSKNKDVAWSTFSKLPPMQLHNMYICTLRAQREKDEAHIPDIIHLVPVESRLYKILFQGMLQTLIHF